MSFAERHRGFLLGALFLLLVLGALLAVFILDALHARDARRDLAVREAWGYAPYNSEVGARSSERSELV